MMITGSSMVLMAMESWTVLATCRLWQSRRQSPGRLPRDTSGSKRSG